MVAGMREAADTIEALVDALLPFAGWIADRDSNHATRDYPDDCPLIYYPEGYNRGAATIGDLRRALTVLKKIKNM